MELISIVRNTSLFSNFDIREILRPSLIHTTNFSLLAKHFRGAILVYIYFPAQSKQEKLYICTGSRTSRQSHWRQRHYDCYNPEMMTALSPVPSKQTSNGPHQNGVMTNGKRKAPPTGAGKRDEQQGKRRRKSSNTPTNTAEETSHMNGIEEDKKPVPKSNHLRFGSEEPVLLEETPAEIPAAPNHDEEDEDSDDDAPEAIDNSAQLLKIKEQAKKQETAKQVYVFFSPLTWSRFLIPLQRGTIEKGEAAETGRAP